MRASMKKPPLAARHAIKQAMKEMNDDSIWRTKLGKIIFEGITRAKKNPPILTDFEKRNIREAIETRNWKKAMWIVMDAGLTEQQISKKERQYNCGGEDRSKDEALENLVAILIEMYRRECVGEDPREKREQWLTFSEEVFEGLLVYYAKNEDMVRDVAELLKKAVDFASEKIETEERDKITHVR